MNSTQNTDLRQPLRPHRTPPPPPRGTRLPTSTSQAPTNRGRSPAAIAPASPTHDPVRRDQRPALASLEPVPTAFDRASRGIAPTRDVRRDRRLSVAASAKGEPETATFASRVQVTVARPASAHTAIGSVSRGIAPSYQLVRRERRALAAAFARWAPVSRGVEPAWRRIASPCLAPRRTRRPAGAEVAWW
jgi:hypothetical protein